MHGGRGLGPLEPAAWLGWVSPSDPLPHGLKGARRPAQASQKLSHPLLILSPAAAGRLIPPKLKEKVAPPPQTRPAPQPIPAAGTAPGRWPSPARPRAGVSRRSSGGAGPARPG